MSDSPVTALPAHVLQQRDMRRALAVHDFGTVFFMARKWAGVSYSKISDAIGIKPERIGRLARGDGAITSYAKFCEIADALRIPGAMIGLATRPWEAPTVVIDCDPAPRSAAASAPAPILAHQAGQPLPDTVRPGMDLAIVHYPVPPPDSAPAISQVDLDAELEALELARRVEASDVGNGTLTRLEAVADEVAMAYATTPPAELLPRVCGHLDYVVRLIESRKTLQQHQRLLVTGGWLSLTAATLHIDLRHRDAAHAFLITAEQMAHSAGQDEIRAWCDETRAWDMLTGGQFREALELSQRAQDRAPARSSALIQATAQEGRACARMGQPLQTRDVLARVSRLVANLPMPEHPEHHYRYDPSKAISYTATTLAWIGDPAAEDYARVAIDELTPGTGDIPRPRRLASARLDLGLALLAADRPDEASAEALAAITSGRIVPSNWWRATEVLHGIADTGAPQITQLRDAYAAYRPAPPSTTGHRPPNTPQPQPNTPRRASLTVTDTQDPRRDPKLLISPALTAGYTPAIGASSRLYVASSAVKRISRKRGDIP
jgi:transcriptional regulator with XRE-family HTH domain